MNIPVDWKMYSHRNGEAEPPNMPGAYIFVGKFAFPFEFAFLFFYYPFPGDAQDTVQYADDETELRFSELGAGKWYGPVATESPHVATPALIELKELASWEDYEAAHIRADAILCELLALFGYGEIVEAFKKVRKWYA